MKLSGLLDNNIITTNHRAGNKSDGLQEMISIFYKTAICSQLVGSK